MLRTLLTGLLSVAALSGSLAARPQDLSQFMGSAPACLPDAKPTPGVAADGTFKAGAPLRSVLASATVPGTRLTLSGTVAGIKCGRIVGAEVDLWQADVRGAYDMSSFSLRGRQLTDKDGRYTFVTVVPGTSAGRAKHLNLRVRVKGHPEFFTEIYFPDDPSNARDKRFRNELLMQPKQAAAGSKAATFDVLLDM